MTGYKRRRYEPTMREGGAEPARNAVLNDKRKPRVQSVDPIDSHVGRQLRAIRTKLGISQEKLADQLGVSFQQVQKYEKGSNRVSASRLKMASEFLDIPVTYFFDGAPTLEKRPIPALAKPAPDLAKRQTAEMGRLFAMIQDAEFRAHLLGLVRAMAEKERSFDRSATQPDK